MNAQKIAEAAIAMERQTGVPAELAATQCCLESGWGERAPGNNPFGIKAHSCADTQTCQTKEFLTDKEAAAWKAKGKKIEPDLDASGQPIIINGKKRYTVSDVFAAYPDLSAAFLDYANLLKTGKYFKPCWDQYQANQNRAEYIKQMCSIYATDPQYHEKFLQIAGGKRLTSAIAKARASVAFFTT